MAIDTLDKLIAGLATAQRLPFMKTSVSNWATSMDYGSFWKIAGIPGVGATPPTGAGEAPTKATSGAMHFDDAGAGEQLHIAGLSTQEDEDGTLVIADRLVHTSGLSGTVTTEQAVNSAALTRYTDGVGVRAFIEWYAATGSTTRTMTVDYVNQAGVSKTSPSFTFPVSSAAGVGRLCSIPLAAGDYGVRQVEGVTLSGTTGTAGDFGITLLKFLASIYNNSGAVLGAVEAGLEPVDDDACLQVVTVNTSATVGPLYGLLTLASG